MWFFPLICFLLRCQWVLRTLAFCTGVLHTHTHTNIREYARTQGPWYIITCLNAAEPFDLQAPHKCQKTSRSYATEMAVLAKQFMHIAQVCSSQ